MWQPQPGWHLLQSGSGGSTVGVWRTVLGDQAVVVKRIAAPHEGDPPQLSERRHFAYWRRAADVVTSGVVVGTPGLRAPRLAAVEEDQRVRHETSLTVQGEQKVPYRSALWPPLPRTSRPSWSTR